MKVLKNPDQVLQIMNRKLDELHKRFDEADEKEATEISGQEAAIISVAGHIRHAIEDYGYFGVKDMASTTLKEKTTSTVIPEIPGS